MGINIEDYVNSKLMVVVAVCYMLGMMLKRTPHIKNWLIPYILTAISIILCFLWFLAYESDTKPIANIIFESITQGFLCSASAVFINQVIKQTTNK